MRLRAFVTGGTGFVGTNLLRELVERGWEVTALVRETSPLEDIENLDIKRVTGDITDAQSVFEAMPPGVDGVFHVAASTSIWSGNNTMQTAINVDGTRNVVAAALTCGAQRFIHTSSFVVWGFHKKLLTEESPRLENADWINYVRSKHEAENIVKEAVKNQTLDAVILNPAHILGPGDRHNWSRVIRLVNERKLPGVPSGGGNFADVREVARAHIQAFHRGKTGQNYILGGEDTMFLEVVKMTGEILDRNVPRRATPAWLLKAVARLYVLKSAISGKEPDLTPEGAAMITQHIPCDSSKARRELGYQFTPVRALLEDSCAWLRNKGILV